MSAPLALSIDEIAALPTPTGPGAITSLVMLLRQFDSLEACSQAHYEKIAATEVRLLVALANTAPTSQDEEVAILRFTLERMLTALDDGVMEEEIVLARHALLCGATETYIS